MCQISFHVRDFCRALTQLVHCPCWGCWTAFWILVESSLSRISLMTLSLFSFPSDFDHHFAEDDPSLLRSVWICPITSLILRHSLTSSTVLTTFHLPPVFIVSSIVFTTGSSKSSNIMSSLALPHLYSSKMDFGGGGGLSFVSVHCHICEIPNHLLVNLLILASMKSKWSIVKINK